MSVHREGVDNKDTTTRRLGAEAVVDLLHGELILVITFVFGDIQYNHHTEIMIFIASLCDIRIRTAELYYNREHEYILYIQLKDANCEKAVVVLNLNNNIQLTKKERLCKDEEIFKYDCSDFSPYIKNCGEAMASQGSKVLLIVADDDVDSYVLHQPTFNDTEALEPQYGYLCAIEGDSDVTTGATDEGMEYTSQKVREVSTGAAIIWVIAAALIISTITLSILFCKSKKGIKTQQEVIEFEYPSHDSYTDENIDHKSGSFGESGGLKEHEEETPLAGNQNVQLESDGEESAQYKTTEIAGPQDLQGDGITTTDVQNVKTVAEEENNPPTFEWNSVRVPSALSANRHNSPGASERDSAVSNPIAETTATQENGVDTPKQKPAEEPKELRQRSPTLGKSAAGEVEIEHKRARAVLEPLRRGFKIDPVPEQPVEHLQPNLVDMGVLNDI